MSNDVVRRIIAEAIRTANAAYVFDRRNPVHPSNLNISAELGDSFIGLQTDLEALDIDLDLFLTMFRRR